MKTLNIDAIEQSVSGQLEVVQKTKELQKVVSRVFPGYQVTLTHANEMAPLQAVTDGSSSLIFCNPPFGELSGIQQIEQVLKENGQVMKLQPLYEKLGEKGASMSMQTMMSLLSKYQKEGKFKRFGYGLWGLPSQMGDPDAIL